MKRKPTKRQPYLLPEDKRGVTLQIRVTALQAQVIRNRAEKAHLSVSSFMRERALGAAQNG